MARSRSEASPRRSYGKTFTSLEQDILGIIGVQRSNPKELSKQLGISENAVNIHVGHLKRKLKGKIHVQWGTGVMFLRNLEDVLPKDTP